MPQSLLFPTQAYELMTAYLLPIKFEMVPLLGAYRRVLTKNITYLCDQPPFDKAEVDGFAYYTETFPFEGLLSCADGIVAAGGVKSPPIPKGFCIPIMTGAPIPVDCNATHRVEYTDSVFGNGQRKIRFTQTEKSRNIIQQGQNAQKGSLLISPCILGAKEVALLASSGYAQIEVSKKLKVGLVSTGSELSPLGEDLAFGKIYDANGPLIYGWLEELGVEANLYGICADNYDDLLKKTELIQNENDVIILSGGISVGELDYTKKVFQALEVKQIFHGIAMKPGKPLYFGVKENKAFFGVPGNPVSTFVCFENFIKPYVYGCMGLSYQAKNYILPIHSSYTRQDIQREEYIPSILVQGGKGLEIEPLPYKGSSMLSVLSEIQALIKIDAGVKEFCQGEGVYARLL